MRFHIMIPAMILAVTLPATASAQRSKSQKKAEPTQAQLRAEAKITEEAARATALKAVPGGTIKSSELEREGGKLIYSFDIKVGTKPGIDEVNVDAITGSVIAKTHESPVAERKEAKQEAKEKAKAKPKHPNKSRSHT